MLYRPACQVACKRNSWAVGPQSAASDGHRHTPCEHNLYYTIWTLYAESVSFPINATLLWGARTPIYQATWGTPTPFYQATWGALTPIYQAIWGAQTAIHQAIQGARTAIQKQFGARALQSIKHFRARALQSIKQFRALTLKSIKQFWVRVHSHQQTNHPELKVN